MRTQKTIRWDYMVALADLIVKENPVQLGMTEERVVYAVAISTLVHSHGIASNTVTALCYALGTPVEVLALVEQGIPTDYILATVGAQ